MQNILHRYSRMRAGLGLVLLRFGLALLLLEITQPAPAILGSWGQNALWWAALGIAIVLVVGAATPIAAALATLFFLWDAFVIVDATLQHGSMAMISLVCVLIGGGPWSMDAILFGRKRIEIPRN